MAPPGRQDVVVMTQAIGNRAIGWLFIWVSVLLILILVATVVWYIVILNWLDNLPYDSSATGLITAGGGHELFLAVRLLEGAGVSVVVTFFFLLLAAGRCKRYSWLPCILLGLPIMLTLTIAGYALQVHGYHKITNSQGPSCNDAEKFDFYLQVAQQLPWLCGHVMSTDDLSSQDSTCKRSNSPGYVCIKFRRFYVFSITALVFALLSFLIGTTLIVSIMVGRESNKRFSLFVVIPIRFISRQLRDIKYSIRVGFSRGSSRTSSNRDKPYLSKVFWTKRKPSSSRKIKISNTLFIHTGSETSFQTAQEMLGPADPLRQNTIISLSQIRTTALEMGQHTGIPGQSPLENFLKIDDMFFSLIPFCHLRAIFTLSLTSQTLAYIIQQHKRDNESFLKRSVCLGSGSERQCWACGFPGCEGCFKGRYLYSCATDVVEHQHQNMQPVCTSCYIKSFEASSAESAVIKSKFCQCPLESRIRTLCPQCCALYKAKSKANRVGIEASVALMKMRRRSNLGFENSRTSTESCVHCEKSLARAIMVWWRCGVCFGEIKYRVI